MVHYKQTYTSSVNEHNIHYPISDSLPCLHNICNNWDILSDSIMQPWVENTVFILNHNVMHPYIAIPVAVPPTTLTETSILFWRTAWMGEMVI